MDTVKILKRGKRQAIQLPEEVHFPGSQVYIKKVGNVVILIPEEDSWQSLIESLDLFTPDFMQDREQPPIQTREDIFE